MGRNLPSLKWGPTFANYLPMYQLVPWGEREGPRVLWFRDSFPLFLSLSEVLPVVTCTWIVPPMRWQYIVPPEAIPYNFTSTLMSQDFTNRFIPRLDIFRINITQSLSLLSAASFQSPSVAFLAIYFIFLLSFYIIFYIF